MHFLYILYGNKADRYYSGQTESVENRLEKHNNGHSASTKSGIPWQLKKVIEFETKTEAIRAENWLKKMKSFQV